MTRKSISVKVGIYDTAYKLIEHRDGSVTVMAPWIRWVGSSGNLDFAHITITNPLLVSQIIRFFDNDILVDDTGETLDNLIF